MKTVRLPELTAYLDGYLRTREIADYPGALNGLQLENSGGVTNVAAAVDACEYTIDQAAASGADLLLVHHGLMWGDLRPMTGARYRWLRRAIEAGLAVYSSHLPLDAHPEVGNAARLCAALGFSDTTPFFDYKGTALGLRVKVDVGRDEVVARLSSAVDGGPVNVCPGGPDRVRNLAIVTGGAGAEVGKVAAEGVDTFITGEGPHWSYPLAEELGINLLYAGHYATETFGVKALARHLETRYGLPWKFIHHPTGL